MIQVCVKVFVRGGGRCVLKSCAGGGRCIRKRDIDEVREKSFEARTSQRPGEVRGKEKS